MEVSGVMGVVACATILTPMGPPLLVGALLFGGTSTAVSTSSEVVNYYSEPNQVADKIIALYGMAESIVGISRIFRDGILRDHIHLDPYVDDYDAQTNKDEDESTLASSIQDSVAQIKEALEQENVQRSIKGTKAVANYAAAGQTAAYEMGGLATKNGRFLSRATTSALRAAKFAQFAGAALSAATIALEAREMKRTVDSIRAGHPCDKADTLRQLKQDVMTLPETKELARECDQYLAVLKTRLERIETLKEESEREGKSRTTAELEQAGVVADVEIEAKKPKAKEGQIRDECEDEQQGGTVEKAESNASEPLQQEIVQKDVTEEPRQEQIGTTIPKEIQDDRSEEQQGGADEPDQSGHNHEQEALMKITPDTEEDKQKNDTTEQSDRQHEHKEPLEESQEKRAEENDDGKAAEQTEHGNTAATLEPPTIYS